MDKSIIKKEAILKEFTKQFTSEWSFNHNKLMWNTNAPSVNQVISFFSKEMNSLIETVREETVKQIEIIQSAERLQKALQSPSVGKDIDVSTKSVEPKEECRCQCYDCTFGQVDNGIGTLNHCLGKYCIPEKISDALPFKHGEEGTHYACTEMVNGLGKDVGCCGCNGHICKDVPLDYPFIKSEKGTE